MPKNLISNIQRWRYYHQSLLYTPLQQLQAAEHYEWQAITDDPAFAVQPAVGPMPRGWYMLEVKVRANRAQCYSKLYVNYGSGYHEINCYGLALKSGKLSKRVIFFPAIPKSLRFDPCEQVAALTIQHLSLHKLTARKATQLMEKKLAAKKVPYQTSGLPLLEQYNLLFDAQVATPSYQQWIDLIETPLFGDIEKQYKAITTFQYQPLISVVMPVFNTPERFLQEAIESVLNQSYPHWELCIADDCSTALYIKPLLEAYAAADARIKVVFREHNGHIAAASNSAISLATGDYIALLDHDDKLSPHALYCIVEALNQSPTTELLYSDEDFIDEDGHRLRPHFKSQWNPMLLHSHNYITHLLVVKRQQLQAIDGFRVGFEGAQDYDLLLRLSHIIEPENIKHIPHILYHWRACEGSTAASASAKNYATDAGLQALKEKVTASAMVNHDILANFYRVDYPLPVALPLVTILVPTRNALEVVKPCIESILKKTTYPNYEILLIDNQSDDPEALAWFATIEKNPKVRLLHYANPFNYSAINNYAAQHAKGSVLALLNNDIEVITDSWLEEMVSLAVQPNNGCVGAKLYYPDGDIQHAGVILGLGGYAAHSHRGMHGNHAGYFNRANTRQNISAVTGACLMVEKTIFDRVGGLDERYTVAYNDVDFCLKVLSAGYLNVFTPYAELMHHESKTRGFDDTSEKQARFNKEKALLASRWQILLDNDPYYNPNLTREREDFSIRI